MNSSEFKEAIRFWCLRHASNASAIREKVGSRVYPAQLANITDPEYPCACFDTPDSQLIEKLSKASSGMLRIWSFSQKSLAEAGDIQALLFTALHMNRINVKSLWVVCWETSRPMDNYDPVEDVHYYMSQWSFNCLEV